MASWRQVATPGFILLCALGFGVLGWRSMLSERALVEQTARSALRTTLVAKSGELEKIVGELERCVRGEDPTRNPIVFSASGEQVAPPPPQGLTWQVYPPPGSSSALAVLWEGDAAEGDGRMDDAMTHWQSVRESPDPLLREMALTRIASYHRRNGDSDALRALTPHVSDLPWNPGALTPEGLVLRVLNAPEAREATAAVMGLIGGPDDLLARRMARDLVSISSAQVAARDRDLAEARDLRDELPTFPDQPHGVLLRGRHVIAFSREPNRLALARGALPDLPEGMTVGPRPKTDDLVETAPVLNHPDIQLHAVWPRHAVEADARQRMIVTIAGLITLVGGATLVVVMMVRAQKRDAKWATERASFLARMSHDVRTPLATIQLYAESLAEGQPDPATQAQFAGIVAQEARRVSSMVEKALTLIRKGPLVAPPRERVHLGDVAREALDTHRTLRASRPAEADLEITDPHPVTWGDAEALRSAVANLVENALLHGDGRTEMTVRIGGTTDRVIVTVSDRGPGLPAEMTERIFEPFVRGTQRTGGLGLGLTWVQETARAHGGSVVAENRPGGGTTFTLTLPRAERRP